MKEHARILLFVSGNSSPGKPGALLETGSSIDLSFSLDKTPYPARRRLRVSGEVDVFWALRCEPGMPTRTYRSISDALDSRTHHGEKYSLRLSGNNDGWTRNAYVKVMEDTFFTSSPLRGEDLAQQVYTFSTMVKGQDINVAEAGELRVELGIYLRKGTREPSDTFDPPDVIHGLDLFAGSYEWKELSTEVRLPATTACLLVRIGGRGFQGTAWIGTPKLFRKGTDSLIPPLEPESPYWPQLNWLGENLSRKEWPGFRISLDGTTFFEGEVFNSIDRYSDFEVELPATMAGDHRIEVSYIPRYETAVGFRLISAELLEESARPMEIVHCPDYVRENSSFPVLIERNSTAGGCFDVLFCEAGQARTSPEYTIAVDGLAKNLSPVRVVRRQEDHITLSTSDTINIPQTEYDLGRFLEWYLENKLGNALCFRPAYRWSGSRILNPGAWQFIASLLNKLRMEYHLMVDGRELPGKNANPTDELLRGQYYRGRQSHELDGALCYWPPLPDDELFLDIYQRSLDPGGPGAQLRPLRRKNARAEGFRDPCKALDMKEAAEYFLSNIGRQKADTTRHTGPSTLFRYFYQAGYDWLGAEQMYGPEEVILASLRGASKAYGKIDYGAHLATQWSSSPHNTHRHADRLYLSLATCYIQGVNNLNTEDGLWRISSVYAKYDRFSEACIMHCQAHREIYRFIQTHSRRGVLRIPIGVVQGRYCGWRSFGRVHVWGSIREEFAFGPPEQSFDLLDVFYPRSVLDAIYRDHCSDSKPEGWYSGTPYGPVDLMPVEAPLELLRSYNAIAFLGWNTYSEQDFVRLTEYVRSGGTLLLCRPHLSTAVRRNEPASLPDTTLIRTLLGDNYRSCREKVVRTLGSGRVIYFPEDSYPGENGLRNRYRQELTSIGLKTLEAERQRGWIRGNQDVSFTAYDWQEANMRTIYLLNVCWWNGGRTEPVHLLFGASEHPLEVRFRRIETITISENYACMPEEPDVDILSIEESGNKARVTLQSDRGAHLKIFQRDPQAEISKVHVAGGGIQEVVID